MSRARSIIPLIISTSRGLHKRIERKSKTTKMKLSTSDTTNPSVHLTHLIRKMVKTTTKINMHKMELIHDGSKRCLYSRRRRRSTRGRGSRGISSILNSSNVSHLLLGRSRLLMRSLGLGGQLFISPLQRFLTNSTYDRKERGTRNWNTRV